MATTKKRKFSPAQLAAQKKFAAMVRAKAGTKKKAAKKKVAKKKTAGKVAVNAPSRATGKAPSTRLRKRRTKNKTAPKGFYPNPTHDRYYVIAMVGGKKYYFDGVKSLGSKAKAATFSKTELAKTAARVTRGLPSHEGIVAERAPKK